MSVTNNQPLRCIALLCTCSVLVLWSCSENAHGFQVSKTDGGLAIRWPTTSAGFYINPAGAPSAGLSAIQAAMQTWINVTTSNFSFVYKGQTSSTSFGQNDGSNMVCFGALVGAQYDSTLAVNTIFFNGQTGLLSDSDIKFNTNFTWATGNSPDAYDVQTIALHELGHALALDDLYESGDTAKVMYGYCDPGEIKRFLSQDDMDGITYLYPGGGTTTTTTITGSCPAEFVLGQDHPDLQQLRSLRDGLLSRSVVGHRIIQMYYNNSDSINAAIERSPVLRDAARSFFETAALVMVKKQ